MDQLYEVGSTMPSPGPQWERCDPPAGIPLFVPNESVGMQHAKNVGDCIAHPITTQFTYDALLMLIQASRRERIKNYEAIRQFPRKLPCFPEMDESEHNASSSQGATSPESPDTEVVVVHPAKDS